MNVPDRDDIKINTGTGEVVKVDQPKTQDSKTRRMTPVTLDTKTVKKLDSSGNPITGDEEKEAVTLPEQREIVEQVDHQDQAAYGDSGEPQTVDPPDYEPQSSQDDDDDDEDDS